LLDRGSWREVSRITDVLRTETVGGTLLVATAAVALLWANSPGPLRTSTSAPSGSGPPSYIWT
jgi:NhaA family Na+:H+ antiporter